MSKLIDTFAHRLSYAITIRNIKPIELSKKTGISKYNISYYINGKSEAKQDGVKLLAEALNVNPVWLMGYDVPMNNINKSTTKNIYDIPIIKKVNVKNIFDDDNIIEYAPTSPLFLDESNTNLFFIKVQENSLNKEYKVGTYILVVQQNTAKNNDNIIAIVNDKVLLRRFKEIDKQFVMLEPNSTEEYENIIVNLKDTKFKIIGKIIGNL